MLHSVLFSKYGSKTILVVLGILIAALIIDTSIAKLSGLIGREWASMEGVVLFILIGAAFVVGQYIVSSFVNQKAEQPIGKASFVSKIHRLTALVQHTLTAIIALVILQIVGASYYQTITLIVAVTISCSLGVAVMAILAQRFFGWYKSNTNRLILLYGISFTILAVHLGFTIVSVDTVLLNMAGELRPYSGYSSSIFDPSSAYGMLNQIYFASAILSFIVIWGSSVLLLRHHSQRLTKFKFWGIVSLPLVFFLAQYVISYFELYVPLLSLDPVFFATLFSSIFALSFPIGGMLFGFAFLAIVKSLPLRSTVRDYIAITAYGFILFFVSDQTGILYASYPPFGLATISFVGLSCYLILVGVYSSATSLSEDTKLRQSIRKYAIDQSRLLDSIGTAQMEQELRKTVLTIAKKQSDRMVEESGVQPSLSEDDMKKYLEEVIREIKVMR